MEILQGILIALGGLALVFVTRPVTTFIHEMGHALPALLFTQKPVVVYIGSYGDIRNSFKLGIGRLTIYFNLTLFQLDMGLCKFDNKMNIAQLMITVLGGPLLSLIAGSILTWGIIVFKPDDGIIFILSLFIVSTVWDFFVNIIPRKAPAILHDGSFVYNDGAQLKRIFTLTSHLERYNNAMTNLEGGKVEQTIQALKDITLEKNYNRFLVDELIEILVATGRYQEALDILKEYDTQKGINKEQFKQVGDIYLGLKRYEEALDAYNQSWYYAFGDYEVLNGKASALLEMGRFEEAADETEASLQMNSTDNPKAFINRTRISLQERNLENLLEDITHLEKIMPNSPVVPFYRGRYYEEKGLDRQALEQFEQAKNLGMDFHGLELKIEELKIKVK